MTDENFTYANSVTVQAPAPVVFAALTQADQLQRWFLSRAETDPRPGGAFKFAWDFADAAQNGTQQGQFVEVVPNVRASYTWEARPAPAPLTLVTFSLTPNGNATQVSVAHTGFGTGAESQAARDHHAGPWDFYMANLKSFLETGVDNRTAMLKQTTL